MNERAPGEQTLEHERQEVLAQIEAWFESTMLVLGLVWLVLLVVDLVRGLSPLLEGAITVIWVLFIADFALRFTVAPRKLAYLRQNWLTAVSLVLPAFRLFGLARLARVFRVARATRGLRLVNLVSALNRGMRSLRASMHRRGLGYVITLTAGVTLVGAAGMYAFERDPAGGPGLNDYGNALWWTAMLMTTVGSEYWPRTPEGRLLCFFLSLYALGILGYVAASLASFFVGRDAANETAEVAGSEDLRALRAEMAALREEIRARSGGRTTP